MKNVERSRVQFLSNLYSHIKERVNNPAKSVNGRNYLGLSVCNKEEFLLFGLTDPAFNRLFSTYKRYGGKRKHAPSIDRIDNTKGYVIGNLQFLTVGENSRKERTLKWIVLQNNKTKKIVRFSSTVVAGRFLNHKREIKINRNNFYDMKTGIRYINKTKFCKTR